MNTIARAITARVRGSRTSGGETAVHGDGEGGQSADEVRRRALKPVRDAVRATSAATGGPGYPGIRAAVAASSRLARMLACEWDQTDLRPGTARDAAAGSTLDLLLIELRRSGVPGWTGQIDELADVAAAVRARTVPVVIWVTDSAAGPDVAADLIATASDVFLVDGASSDQWAQRWPGVRVGVLPPATTPRLHSPAHGGGGSARAGDALLLADEATVGEAAVAGLQGLVVPASRMSALPDLHFWRPKKDPANDTAAPVPGSVGKAAVAGTVVDAGEPFVDHYRVLVDAARATNDSSWTLLDAGAAQTAVVSLPEYHTRLPADLRAHVSTAEHSVGFGREIVARLRQPEVRDREALRLQRAVLAGHTSGHRVATILETVGRDVTPVSRSVSVVVPTNREHQIDNVLANIARQEHRDIEVILVLHGVAARPADVRARAASAGIERIQVLHADASAPLGSVMNLGVDAASGRYTAKMDDDNHYGRHYLTDLVNAFSYTDAGVVGKWSHYVWLRSSDAVVLRYADHQNSYHRLVQGGSIVVETELARQFGFSDIPRAVDTDFLNRIWAAGIRTYSADRYNFVSIRRADHQSHTWHVSDTEMMLGGAQVAFYGDPRAHVDV